MRVGSAITVLVMGSSLLVGQTMPTVVAANPTVSSPAVESKEYSSQPAATVEPDIRPETPVVTLEGICDRPSKIAKSAKPAACKTVITRAGMDALVDTLLPGATPTVRSQFAISYARLLAAAELARQQHMDTDATLTKEIQARQKMAGLQVLAAALYKSLEKNASTVPRAEVLHYYTLHAASYEQGEVQRITLPKSAQTVNGQPLDAVVLRAKADTVRARAAAGEDFPKLQEEAYKDLGIKTVAPPTMLSLVRRVALPAEEATVFDLAPGATSEVVDRAGALVILKLDSKKVIPVDDVQAEIEAFLQRQRLQEGLRSASSNVKANFNLKYLGVTEAPELFPPLSGRQPQVRQHMASNMRSMMPTRHAIVRAMPGR